MHRAGNQSSSVSSVKVVGLVAAGLVAAVITSGCGSTYRPVVSAINPVGPAGQPTKYAYALSNPAGSTTAIIAASGYSIAGNVITVTLSAANTFTAGQVVSLSRFSTSTYLNNVSLTVLATGLTTTQFQAAYNHPDTAATEAGLVSLTGNQAGLLTIADVSGDTILSTPSILPNPSYFSITSGGAQGFTINSQGAFNDFGLSSPTSLQTKDVIQTTLPAASSPVSVTPIAISGSAQALFVPEVATSKIAALNLNGPSLIQEISVGANPVYMVGVDGALRAYAISQNTSGNGQVAAIEGTTLSVSATIPVGVKPVYGVMSADGKRAFIMNKGSNTVTVINVFTNTLDATTPTIAVGSNPVWADFSPLTTELVVLNAGDGVGQGSVSIINIPLCTDSSQTSNPLCNATNPTDATGFGQVIATVPVGINPTMVSVLRDGSRAYVINQRDAKCATGEGSVSVVNLTTGQLSSTICGISTPAGTVAADSSPTLIYGHPNSIAVTNGNPTGKVYVTSGDSRYMTVIYTDTDSVTTHLPLQGTGIRVLVSQP